MSRCERRADRPGRSGRVAQVFTSNRKGRLHLATMAPAKVQAYADVTGGGRPALT
jgi:hypothetical protein